MSLLDDYDHLVIGFPTYHGDPSASIRTFIERLPVYTRPKKIFAFTTCGLYSANTLRIFTKQCLTKKLVTVHSQSYRCPASDGSLLAPRLQVVFRFEKGLVEKVKGDVDAALAAFAVADCKTAIPPFNLLVSSIIPISSVGSSSISLFTPSRELCSKCGVCVQVCPHDCFDVDAQGIPHHRMDACEHCYRCLHTCPSQALTLRKKRVVERQLNKQFFAGKWEELVGRKRGPISFRGYPARRQAVRGFIASSIYELSGTRISEFVEQEFDNFARCHMEKVFIGKETYKDPFSKDIAVKKIIWDIAYEIQDPLLSALIAVSKERQHNGFFVTVLDGYSPDSEAYLKHKFQYHWYVPFSDIHQYRNLVGPLENAVYAEDGSWGVMISYGWHSFLGCDEDVSSRVIGIFA